MLTAFRALKIAQRRLRPEVRSKLLGIFSARSDDSLQPEAWRFVFLDAGTSENSRVVTVAARASSEHPRTVEAFAAGTPEFPSGGPALAQNRLVIDSNDAIDRVRAAVKLRGVRSAQYELVQPRGRQEPAWTLSIFAEGLQALVRFRIGVRTGRLEQLPTPERRGA